MYANIQQALGRDYAVVFPVAAVIILLILGMLLRSVVAPWYLILRSDEGSRLAPEST